MDKIEIMRTVVDDLYATEKAIDDAIAQSSDLIATFIQSRRDMNLSAVVGAKAQSKVLEAIAALGVARDAVVVAHNDLAKVQRQVGLGHVATGPVDKPTEEEGNQTMTPIGGGRPRGLHLAVS
jgi:hypothetical protein